KIASSYQHKDYLLPSGQSIKVQGFEPFCLDEFLENGITEEEILKGYETKPSIQYCYQEKLRIYFPDLYLPSKNCLIEVKSPYTYSIETDLIFTKLYACFLQGYNVELR